MCFLEEVTEARADFTRRKISRQAPSARVVVYLLGQSNEIRSGKERCRDSAPRSLKGVLLAIEKDSRIPSRLEQ